MYLFLKIEYTCILDNLRLSKSKHPPYSWVLHFDTFFFQRFADPIYMITPDAEGIFNIYPTDIDYSHKLEAAV